jgi:hypothetical protein
LARTYLLDEIEQLGPRVTLDIEFNVPPRQHARDVANVLGHNVTAIGSRVNGNARSAGSYADVHGIHDAGHTATARIPKRGHLINVNGKANHKFSHLVIWLSGHR